VLRTTSRYVLYTAPSSGHAEYVALADREQVSSAAKLFVKNRAFVNGPGPAARIYTRWDFPGPSDRVVSGDVGGCASGTLRYERVQTSRFDFIASCPNDATLVVKETYHPNWRATVDGQVVETFMVSPSFIGIALSAGDHFVTFEYRSTPIKTPLFLFGLLAVVALILARRDLPDRIRDMRRRLDAGVGTARSRLSA
jgi:hypothetical protein